MKKGSTYLVLIVFLVLLFVQYSYGQYGNLKGGASAQIGVGFTEVGILATGGFSKNFTQEISGVFNVSYNGAEVSDINYHAIYLDGIASYLAYTVGQGRFNLSTQGGISFVGDFRNDFANDVSDSRFSMNYGFMGGVEIEIAALKSFGILMIGNARYYIKEDYGKFRYQFLTGIRYAF